MLQFITHCTEHYSYLDGAIAALKGGCKWIQLRMKDAPLDEIKRTAQQLKPLCHKHEALLIVDDHAEIVTELDIDGVHLGKNDMPIAEARELLGEKYIIGGTANTFEDIVTLTQQGADYIGLGPFRFTTTKQNLSPIIGIEGYRRIVAQCLQAGIETPLVAIGGIEVTDMEDIMATGVAGIALSGAILRADNPTLTTEKIINNLNQIKHGK